ncbi:ATP-binding protein [Candidatus Woesearchaeota archaeon]|nr:ATP-binding protein [Candidatus Woesearchaeota archaeon]
MEHKKIVINWKEFNIPDVLPRLSDIDLSVDFIITISGPRRAGKTYFCFQLMQKLMKNGISRENIFYINFEDNHLLGANADDLDKILEHFLELSEINKKQKIYLFFDEIQIVKDWDSWARKVYDQRKDIRLILTGSSSKLLSKEISTKLRGRVINKEIFPLSFKETLSWGNVPYNLKTISHSKEKAAVKKAFSQFLINGGYPALFIDKTLQKEQILQSYYDSVIFKDIIERYKIEDVKKLKSLAQLLFQSVSSDLSYSNLANRMKTIGFDISKNTVIEHISYFEDAYLFFQNLKYEYSVSQQMGSIKKLYCVDNGILNAVSFKFSENIGKLLENLVFIELKRKNESVYRHKAKNDCDFLIVRKNKVSEAIQVTQKLDETTEKREIDGLIEALKEHKLNEGLILTEEQEGERTVEGKKIVIKPVWQWLLEK